MDAFDPVKQDHSQLARNGFFSGKNKIHKELEL